MKYPLLFVWKTVACGTPVIAKVEGIPEYLNNQNGILIENNSFECWYFNIKFFT